MSNIVDLSKRNTFWLCIISKQMTCLHTLTWQIIIAVHLNMFLVYFYIPSSIIISKSFVLTHLIDIVFILSNYSHTPHTTKLWGGIYFHSIHLSLCPIIHPSCLSCSVCNTYNSGRILSTSGTNEYNHEGVCLAQWHLILTYIFKVIQPWLFNKTAKLWHILPCPLYSMYSSGPIISLFGTNDQ